MMLYWLDLFGVFVFAISGALAADRRGMDLFGFIAISLLPAIGGGYIMKFDWAVSEEPRIPCSASAPDRCNARSH